MAGRPVSSVVCVEDERVEVLPVVLIVHSEARLGELKRLLREVGSEQKTFVAMSAMDGIRRARQQHPEHACGALLQRPEQLMSALEAGADDAILCSSISDRVALDDFVERVRVRAHQRRERESRANASERPERDEMNRLLAGLAHEVNNPLTALQLTVEAFAAQMAPLVEAARSLRTLALAGEGASAAQVRQLATQLAGCHCESEGRELLAEMSDAARVVADVVRDVRILSRLQREEEAYRLVRVEDLTEQAVRLVGREIDKHGTVERDYRARDALVSVPGARLTQVLVNVLINASHAIGELPGRLHRVRISTRVRDGFVAVSIADTGPGIPPGVLEHVFDPYFTTKGESGTGLGLSIARKFMREMKGELLVHSVYGHGATFSIRIPAAEPAALSNGSDGETFRPPLAATPTSVLVADQDERVLKALVRWLGRRFHLMLARDAEEAMRWIATAPNLSVVIADGALADRRGQPLMRWLQETHPRLAARTILMMPGGEGEPGAPCGARLRKPLAPVALEAALRAALQGPDSSDGDTLMPLESGIRQLR